MYLNGVTTGMAIIAVVHRPIPKAPIPALTVYFVAAVGTAVRGAHACYPATTARLISGAAILASAWPAIQNRSVGRAEKERTTPAN